MSSKKTGIVLVKSRNGDGYLVLWPYSIEEAEEFAALNGWVVLVVQAEKATKIARPWVEVSGDCVKEGGAAW